LTPLDTHINTWIGRPFVWGECDCMLVLADWVAEVRGVDPAAEIRGQYWDALSCERLTGFITAPVEAAARFFDTAGLERTDTPARGDIGVLRLAGERHAVGALWNGAAWIMKGEAGATSRRADMVEVLAIWGVGYDE